MSDPYLLAASLFTIGPIPVPPLPPLPPTLPESLSTLLASAATQALRSIVAPQAAPTLETSAPEFSQSQPSPPQPQTNTPPESTPTIAREATVVVSDRQALAKPQPISRPVSGSQLFIQRLAALKAGQLYTRLPADSFQKFWGNENLIASLLQQEPTHEQWKYLLEQEAKAVALGQGDNRLGILVGDSLSLWFPSERLPSSSIWLNQGISGENSTQILNRLSAFSQTRPSTIYVMAGTNDLRQGVSDRVILDNIRQIVRRLRQNHPQARAIVQSILPMRLTNIPVERISNLNQQIALIAEEEGAGYLNLYKLFADELGQMRQDLTTDGIHLSSRGYEVWQEGLNYTESAIARSQSTRLASE